jgi:hypothetical protein
VAPIVAPATPDEGRSGLPARARVRHTVRDHTKAIFAKLGVTSRPELTAMLYHDHHVASLGEAAAHASRRSR